MGSTASVSPSRGCRFSGLRKVAGRRLAEAGCTSKEIAALLGHRTLSEVNIYTRSADQLRLSDTAIQRLKKAETRTG